jgi:hypothetical protein
MRRPTTSAIVVTSGPLAAAGSSENLPKMKGSVIPSRFVTRSMTFMVRKTTIARSQPPRKRPRLAPSTPMVRPSMTPTSASRKKALATIRSARRHPC